MDGGANPDRTDDEVLTPQSHRESKDQLLARPRVRRGVAERLNGPSLNGASLQTNDDGCSKAARMRVHPSKPYLGYCIPRSFSLAASGALNPCLSSVVNPVRWILLASLRPLWLTDGAFALSGTRLLRTASDEIFFSTSCSIKGYT